MTNSSRPSQPGDTTPDVGDLEDAMDQTTRLPLSGAPLDNVASEPPPAEDSSNAPRLPGDEDKRAAGPAASETAPVDASKIRAAESDRCADTAVGMPSFESPKEVVIEGSTLLPAPVGGVSRNELSSGEANDRASEDAVGAAAPLPQEAQSERLTPPISSRKSERRDESTARAQRNRLLIILLASYASAITLGFVWLLVGGNASPHELEHLPDVPPLDPSEFLYVPENATLPPGHSLPVGEQQQFGYIRVEPLRVTRGPVEFTHFADSSQMKSSTEPVLKLWLRFTNVSQDQLIAPLDATLLFRRKYDDVGETEIANQLVVAAQRDDSVGARAFVLDHPETSEWDLKGQRLGHRLKPGESFETYIPTNPGDDGRLAGELRWRVHLRKGYHSETGHGVTTLIEVPFRSDDIQNESAAS